VAKPDEIRRALLDASCLIGIIAGDPAFAPLRSLLRAIDAGRVTLVESTAILTEVLPMHPDGDATRRETIRNLLESPRTELIDVTTVVANRAADLRVVHNLKTWDAIHLATGIVSAVDVVFVRDSKFPTGQTIDGVYVSEPYDIDGDTLPLDLDGAN
jgi:predicted nucleic acid-binding protein